MDEKMCRLFYFLLLLSMADVTMQTIRRSYIWTCQWGATTQAARTSCAILNLLGFIDQGSTALNLVPNMVDYW